MPTSAPGRSDLSGFTLIEMMVVLLVVGISLGLVTPHFMKSDEEVLQEEAVRLVALMEYAADSAGARGQWLAWSRTAAGYRFLQRDEERNVWQPVTSDAVLRERELPAGMRFGSVERQVAVSSSLIALSPSGIQAPFQIELSLGNARRSVQGDLLGHAAVIDAAGS